MLLEKKDSLEFVKFQEMASPSAKRKHAIQESLNLHL